MVKTEFDINKAKKGAKIGLRMSAEPCVEIVCYDLEHHNDIDGKDYPILALITDTEGKKHEEHYSINGEYMPPARSNMDLMIFEEGDEDLTEFGKYVKSVIECYATTNGNKYEMPFETAKRLEEKLLLLAEKEILKDL